MLDFFKQKLSDTTALPVICFICLQVLCALVAAEQRQWHGFSGVLEGAMK